MESSKISAQKFTALNAYIIKEKRSKVNHLSFHVRKLGKEKQIKPKASRRKKNKKINRNQ